jgi:hypothetical protein
VFVRSGGVWTEQQVLLASDGAAEEFFGYSVAISGDTMAVGAIHDGVDDDQRGSVYVFVRSGDTWVEQQELFDPEGVRFEQFGQAVAVDGDTIVVSAYCATIAGAGCQGAILVFARDGGVWGEPQKLTASDGAGGDRLGMWVAIEGDTIVTGSRLHDVGDQVGQGEAYVFVRSGGVWTEHQLLLAGDGAAGHGFGFSGELDGDTLVIGAPFHNFGGPSVRGAAYVFTRSDGTWTQRQTLIASDGAETDEFGSAAVVEGDTLVVGAESRDVGDHVNQGSIYLFTRTGETWTEAAVLAAADGGAGDDFSFSTALSGRTVIVGAPRHDVGGAVDQGSATVFTGLGEQGESCGAGFDCENGLCVDGVCCDSTCGDGATDDCQSCSAALGAAEDGACGALTAAFAPTVTCRPAAGTCDVAETCTSTSIECPTDAFGPDGDDCDDGVDWTVDDACSGGACAGTEQGSCGEPIVVVVPFTNTNTVSGRPSHVSRYDDSCAASRLDGGDVVYELAVEAGDVLTIEVVPGEDLDVTVVLLDVCDESEDCVAWADDAGPGGTESFVLTSDEAARYTVVVEGSGTGEYVLDVRRSSGPDADADADGDADADTDADADADADGGGDGDGCSCRSAGGRPAAPALVAGALGLLGVPSR